MPQQAEFSNNRPPPTAGMLPPAQPFVTTPPVVISRSRLRVVEEVSVTEPSGDTVPFETRFGRWLETDEQPCIRRLTVGPAWSPLTGAGTWLAVTGHLVIRNDAAQLPTIPTPEEAAEMKTAIVEWGVFVALDGYQAIVPIGEIPLGESARPGMVSDLGVIRLRCKAGMKKITVAMFPY
jgi:hypothetical protein